MHNSYIIANEREILITIQIHTVSPDIVSVTKHTDCEAAFVSATFLLKLLGKSTHCCKVLPGSGDYSMVCDLMEQYTEVRYQH